MAKAALDKAKAKGVELLLPVDNVLADSFTPDAKTQPWDTSVNFPADWQGLDIGPKSIAAIEKVVAAAKTIVWNGPAGVFEFPKFAVGTNAIAHAVAANKSAISIIGGSKISGKIDVIDNLLDKVDTLVIVGGMAYTFQRALGVATGKSLVEEDKIDMAKAALDKAKAKGVNLLLPVDNVLADSFSPDAKTQPWDTSKNFPAEWQGLDIGPKSVAAIEAVVATAKTIVWNGPAGVFEFPKFAVGTNAIAHAVAANKDAISIIGGGDSVSAINQAGVADQITHISTGGGASLEFLEGKKLPGVEALTEK
jgi:3-phosphoglycerate kinase